MSRVLMQARSYWNEARIWRLMIWLGGTDSFGRVCQSCGAGPHRSGNRRRAAVPQWLRPVPGPCHDFSGVARIKGWQITRVALQLGWLDRHAECSICQSRQRVQRHSELYGRPLLCRPVCRDGPFALHRRFRQPAERQSLCDAQRTEHWIRRLPLVELTSDRARKLEQELNPLEFLKIPILC